MTIKPMKTLKRKNLRNKHTAKAKVVAIKQLTFKPIIKNIDVEAVKKHFATKS